MNWIKCTDMNKQPIYVNIENATSIFWVEQEKASIIGLPSGANSIKVIEKPEIIIRGHDMPLSPKGERRLAGGVGTAIMQAKMKFKDDRPFATARKVPIATSTIFRALLRRLRYRDARQIRPPLH